MPIIQAFNNIKRKPLPQTRGIGGFDDLRSIMALQVGVGNRAFKSDESGIWLGAHKWADAPFRVNMQGDMVASSATFGQYLSKAGTSQTLTGDFNLNDARVKIDGTNARILIADASDDRVLMGKF